MIPSMFDRPSGAGALLTTFDSFTPTAGYSLRPLSIKSYGGPVVRVRRESDDVEQDFTASQITDGTLGSFCTGTNGFVHTWYDQSGNGYNAVQVTNTDQPKIYDSVTGLVTENGKPAIDFDGVDDYFPTSLTLNEFSLFLVHKIETSGTYVLIASNTGGSSTQRIATRDTNAAGYEIDNPHTVSGGNQLLTQSLLSVFEQTTDKIYLNANEIASGNSGDQPFTSIDLFARKTNNDFFVNGISQELIIYNSDQLANRTAIEDNINNYYDIY